MYRSFNSSLFVRSITIGKQTSNCENFYSIIGKPHMDYSLQLLPIATVHQHSTFSTTLIIMKRISASTAYSIFSTCIYLPVSPRVSESLLWHFFFPQEWRVYSSTLWKVQPSHTLRMHISVRRHEPCRMRLDFEQIWCIRGIGISSLRHELRRMRLDL